MIGVAFLICIIMTLVCVILVYLKDDSDNAVNFYGGASLFGMVFSSILGFLVAIDNAPTAMDVYQGKTEIQVTSVHGVPIDSVVVFKED